MAWNIVGFANAVEEGLGRASSRSVTRSIYIFHTPVRRMVVSHPELLPATYVQLLLPCYDEICDDSRDPF